MMMVKGVCIPCIILGIVWVAHILFFAFGVKKYTSKEANEEKVQ